MSYPHYDCMERAYQELQAEGKIQTRATQDEVEQDKGLLTRRGAYYAHQRDPSHGLLEKTSGNNSLGYSVDWILRQTDGVGWDVTTDEWNDETQTGMARPVNGDAHPADPAYIPRWRMPTAELAQLPTTPPPEPGPTPPSTEDRLAALEAAVNALIGLTGQVHEMTYHMMTQTWAGDVALALRMHFGVKCPPMPGATSTKALPTGPICTTCGQPLPGDLA